MDCSDYQQLIRPMLSAQRYEHSLCVSSAARELALRYGADPDKAQLAGVLHDIAKEMPPQQQLQRLQEYGIELTPVERHGKKLWHAILGAAYLEREGIITDPEILTAIRYHTTGRISMTLLDQVLFVADFISADRTYQGVEALRTLAKQDLLLTIQEGLAYTIQELAQQKVPIHPDSVAAYNAVCLKNQIRKKKG